MLDVSAQTALLAVQGPEHREPVAIEGDRADWPASSAPLATMSSLLGEVNGVPMVVSRTGYTGELGFEIYSSPERAGDLWDELIDDGARAGLGPAGLGARDTLRFEVCFCLYGHELEEDVSPLEAGIGWTVKLKKPKFIGKEALVRQKATGLPRPLVGFEVAGARHRAPRLRGVARGRGVGRVTSGTWSPTLERSLGLALVETAAAAGPLAVRIRGREVPVQTVPIPFHKPVSRA